MKKLIQKIVKLSPMAAVNILALMLVIENVNVACGWYIYQPEVPEAANKFIKN